MPTMPLAAHGPKKAAFIDRFAFMREAGWSKRQHLRLDRHREAKELREHQLLQPGPGLGRGGAICSASVGPPPS